MSFSDALTRHMDTFNQLASVEEACQRLADQIEACFNQGGKLIFMGNGGSAADSQHLAAEFVVRYKAERKPLAAIALTVDSSILTAHSNDYSYDTVFTRQMEALAKPEDLVIGISTSGNSANVIDATEAAKKIGCKTWAWTGAKGGKLIDIADDIIRAPADETARIQEVHIFVGHWLCEEMDRRVTETL